MYPTFGKKSQKIPFFDLTPYDYDHVMICWKTDECNFVFECTVKTWQCFLTNFILVKKDVSVPKYGNGGGGEVAVLNGDRASFLKLSFSFFQIRIKNGTKNMWDYPTLFLWDNPTFFSIYPTSIPQKGVVHFCRN